MLYSTRGATPVPAAAPVPASPSPAVPSAQDLEAFLRDLLLPAPPADPTPVKASPPGRGRPPLLPAMALWAALLVGLLRGLPCQRDLWRLLACHGLWDYPRFELTDSALYQRLQRTAPTQMQQFFTQLTATLHARLPPASATDLATFAPEIFALDHTVLDPVLRKRGLFRSLPPGAADLLPGALGCVFDVRRQQWQRVDYTELPLRDMRGSLLRLVEGLPVGSLVLFDLGYFSFWGLDTLTDRGYSYVTRLREKLSYAEAHVFYDGPAGPATDPTAVSLRDRLIYLGGYRADRAAHPVRLIELTVGGRTYRYLTNVLDPRVLPAAEVAELYRRRWDIERAFDLIKTELHLQLLWSGHQRTVLLQVYATFILAQVLLALRNQVAMQAGVEVREVSMPLLIRWMPRLAAGGRDPVAEFVAVGRRAGYLRPFRGQERLLPHVPPEANVLPARPVPWRKPRYRSGPASTSRAPARKPPARRRSGRPWRPYGNQVAM